MSANSMNFETFLTCAKTLPAHYSLMIRGDHGIGKSECVFQLGDHFKLKVIDKRLSQMGEGDMIGLPKVEGGVTKFLPPDWYMEACKEPRLLFFDELNRATPEVMQCAFQVVLDRVLNGHKLHPETRVMTAINTSQNYQVNEIDPALLDRFWVVDLQPTAEEWMEHAKKTHHQYVVGCVKSKTSILDPSPKADSSSVEPSRRSWTRFNNAAVAANCIEDFDSPLLFNLARGFLGNEAAIYYVGYVKNLEKQISATDILENFDKNKKKIMGLGQEKWNICIDKIKDYCEKNELLPAHGPNLEKFANILPDELIVVLWGTLSKPGMEKIPQVRIAHKALVKHILRIFKDNPDAMKKNEDKDAAK